MLINIYFDDWFVYSLIVVRFWLASLIMYLSARLKKDFIRNYTLNLYIVACIPCDVMTAIQEITTRNEYILSKTAFSVWGRMITFCTLSFELLVSMIYRVLSLFVVIVLTLPYICPLFYHRMFAHRGWSLHMIAFDLLSCALCAPNIAVYAFTFLCIQCDFFYQHQEIYFLTNQVTSGIACILAVTIVLATTTAIVLIIKVGRAANRFDPNNVQRTLLISFVLYSLPINICNTPLYATAIIDIISPVRLGEGFYHVVEYMEQINYFRTIIIGISTLIALPSYRNAIIDLFGAIKPKRISNSRRATGNVINVTSNTIVMRSTHRKSDT
ncbi:hypothetical protein Tcan_16459 [Toxocara canis]|uniref:G_PROTEIN_RECEP_F1_2 domain-containing protein n=1 Tax=Toxocara canis TaxID=6265 RepID=A0A0B2W1A2_TOXCA|nr:hypothetical protein Tcan_16459 [Toxocara canis]